MTLILHLISLI